MYLFLFFIIFIYISTTMVWHETFKDFLELNSLIQRPPVPPFYQENSSTLGTLACMLICWLWNTNTVHSSMQCNAVPHKCKWGAVCQSLWNERENYSKDKQQRLTCFNTGSLRNNNPNRLCVHLVLTDCSSKLSSGSLIKDERWALCIPVPQTSLYSWNGVSLLWLWLEREHIDWSTLMG